MSAPLIFVAGLGRCGTTATCLALWQGGAPMEGAPPSFEDKPLRERGREWFAMQTGKVVKWIDPVNNPIPYAPPAVSIYLTRDPAEQARSMLKMANAPARRADLRAMAASIRRDEPRAMRRVQRYGPMMVLGFETLINDPALAMWRIHDFLRPVLEFDPAEAARIIAPRAPACMQDMRIEANLTELFA
ncbi:hypothetical protein EU805_01660 [Salipiger sp. IMCC34102]|uniref:hypothetical protein n=1 Tax=Salipiger sp. IMCC34102 TaxID=2510647 RepID=UPI00101B8FA3|nr:hypothetical protein [Salipiger sp. IMCC34102]RYH04104.1 hypothetical protein EU805_01660 [Salipiger sp. IMCC34102]